MTDSCAWQLAMAHGCCRPPQRLRLTVAGRELHPPHFRHNHGAGSRLLAVVGAGSRHDRHPPRSGHHLGRAGKDQLLDQQPQIRGLRRRGYVRPPPVLGQHGPVHTRVLLEDTCDATGSGAVQQSEATAEIPATAGNGASEVLAVTTHDHTRWHRPLPLPESQQWPHSAALHHCLDRTLARAGAMSPLRAISPLWCAIQAMHPRGETPHRGPCQREVLVPLPLRASAFQFSSTRCPLQRHWCCTGHWAHGWGFGKDASPPTPSRASRLTFSQHH